MKENGMENGTGNGMETGNGMKTGNKSGNKAKKIPQILAVYLPQFHETQDNNRWWGKGFTDWESVKTAEPCFEGHEEPRIPLHGEYYDLGRKETMLRQAELAKKYGIGGFCFYHYYFKDGKKELELPAQNLLRWKDIDMPFCFNWASESWIRSWSRISGNVWAERYEGAGEKVPDGILVRQDYGKEDEWRRHFEYLLPFFRDERYIKLDGKPVFLFYSPDDIKPLRQMTACWRELAAENGLPGLYLIGARMTVPDECLDAALVYEPRNSMNRLNGAGMAEVKNGVRCYDYRDMWKSVLETEPFYGYRTYFCGITGYDDTPRRGKSGEALVQDSPGIFREGLKGLLQKSIRYGNEYLFLNAWNEWGEGMYLEPDERSGYCYLEAVRDALRDAAAMPEEDMAAEETDRAGEENIRTAEEAVRREISELDYQLKKFKHLFQTVDRWLFLEQEGRVCFSALLEAEHVDTVAVYGMAALGKHLLLQLKKEGRTAAFGIDRYVGQFGGDCAVYRPEDEFPPVDAIIITAYDTAAVTEMLRRKYQGKIFALDEMVDAMGKQE